MKRILLVILLVLGLFQGFWHEAPQFSICRMGQGETAISEASAEGELICEPRPIQGFAGYFAPGRQQLHPARTCQQISLCQPPVSWSANAPGRDRYSQNPVLPHEWGLVVPLLPRSDG